MAKSRFGVISLRMYVSYGLAYAVPLLVLLFLTFDLKRVEYFKYFFPKFGNDIDILTAITLDRNFTTWESGLRTFYTTRTVRSLEDFNKIDKDWESYLYDLNANAKEQGWIDALRGAEEKRKQVLKLLDETAQPMLALQDAAEKTFLPYNQQMIMRTLALNELAQDVQITTDESGAKVTKRKAREPGAPPPRPVANEVLKLFNTSLNLVIRYALSGDRALIAEARQSFLQLENTLNTLPGGDPQLDKAKGEIRGLVDNFYKDFDALDANHKAVSKASSDFHSSEVQALVKGVNPLLSTEWRAAAEQADSQFIERSFKRMNYFLIIGFVVLSIGFVYSFVHVYTGFHKPFYTVLSYLSHGFISRKRSPVPCQERTDDIGLLARTLNAYLERAQSQIELITHVDAAIAAKAEAKEKGAAAAVSAPEAPAAPPETMGIVYQVDPQARSYLPKIEVLSSRAAEFLAGSERMSDAARRAAERAQESGSLAEETRKAVQEGAAALQELVPQLDSSCASSAGLDDALSGVERQRAKLTLKIRTSQMNVHRLRDSARALYQFADDLQQQASLRQVGAQAQFTLRIDPLITADETAKLCRKTAQQLVEALEFLEVHIQGALASLEEALKSVNSAEGVLLEAQAQAGTLRQKQLSNRDALLLHYSKLQTAAFQAGRLALLLLDVAGDVLETEKNVTTVKFLASDISQSAEELKRTATGNAAP